MEDLRQIFSDKASISAIINKNMPVIISLDKDENSDKVKNIIFNYGMFSIAIPDDSEYSYSFKKALDYTYVNESSVFINLDELINKAKKKI